MAEAEMNASLNKHYIFSRQVGLYRASKVISLTLCIFKVLILPVCLTLEDPAEIYQGATPED